MHICRFKRSNVITTYRQIILSTNDPQLWLLPKVAPINPSIIKRAIDHPKKNCNKENDETKKTRILPKYFKTIKCKKCENMRYNKRTCKEMRATKINC